MAMRTHGPAPRKSRLAKGLSLCCIFTLLTTVAFTIWFNMTNGYSAMLQDEDIALIQLDEPKAGDPYVIMHTDLGDMKYQLYPEQSPQTVANFRALCESGYYNDTYIFRVEKDIFFSGGAKTEDGKTAEGALDTPQENVQRELSPKLWPLRGALCAMTVREEKGFWKTLTGTTAFYTGSRFLVCDTIEMTDEIKEGLRSQIGDNMAKVAETLIEKGGIPNYAQQMTVFGQLVEGFDVLDAITSVALKGEENQTRPEKDLKIRSMELGTFG